MMRLLFDYGRIGGSFRNLRPNIYSARPRAAGPDPLINANAIPTGATTVLALSDCFCSYLCFGDRRRATGAPKLGRPVCQFGMSRPRLGLDRHVNGSP